VWSLFFERICVFKLQSRVPTTWFLIGFSRSLLEKLNWFCFGRCPCNGKLWINW
jgi:hypothetical protein